MEKLSEEALAKAVERLEGWSLQAGELVREFKFADFVGAMAFVNRVATEAEAAGHHPDIDVRYNRVRLGLVTHDSGGITEKDVEMAGRLNGVSIQ
ncbi:MAG: 4a-hydroxytetrahydrobiopterin dehydratase [Acidobacteriota bacterium]